MADAAQLCRSTRGYSGPCAGRVYAQYAQVSSKLFGETAVVCLAQGTDAYRHAMFPAAYPRLVCLNIYFASAYVGVRQRPASAPCRTARLAADSAPAPSRAQLAARRYLFRSSRDLTVILQDKTRASNDGLNNFLARIWGPSSR